MNKNTPAKIRFLTALLLVQILSPLGAQEDASLVIDPVNTRQTITGFGASLAYYEGWLNAHPRRSEVYDLIFGELSLDILRVRNAYGYDPDMVGRVKEYMRAAENSLGHPIQLLSTSWGPIDSLKNTADRKNGGTLRYTTVPGGIEFDYPGFASWWMGSLEEYEANGIMPDYISIQNEPDFSATWESCRLSPNETINATDTIAGYNRALDVIYDSLSTLSDRPMILGPETVGIGYNSVQNYVNALDLSKLDGIAHHLYHGVDEDEPYASEEFTKVGDFHPEVPHFQTEYSRGDWFSLAGLIYKSFHDEEVEGYLYWDLIWGETKGLVTIEFPWDSDRWTDPKGYIINREYYTFKNYSAFIHPGWKRVDAGVAGEELKMLTFISPGMDSMSCVVINRSETENRSLHISIDGYRIRESAVYITSESEECTLKGSLVDSIVSLPPTSIVTVAMQLAAYDPNDDLEAPTVPENLTASGIDNRSFTLAWDPSNDKVGVKFYRVFLDGEELGTTSSIDYFVSGVEPGTSYTLKVSAVDDAGNESDFSAVLMVLTLELDMDPPILEASDSIYQEGIVKAMSSEEGVIYLVPEGTTGEIAVIRTASMDSISVEGGEQIVIPISGLDNGVWWLYARDSVNNLSEPASFTVYGVGLKQSIARQFSLHPNPMDQTATFTFRLQESSDVQLLLFDSRGREVRRVSYGTLAPGRESLVLHRDGLPGGLYLYKMEGRQGTLHSGRLMISH